ncbi:hypothetical protein Lesp01_90150 [Lentzea sp. NBRC 102530]|nr:hypothetical protein Lesp01_90150 [Lentzea sp. NBRC 102530]
MPLKKNFTRPQFDIEKVLEHYGFETPRHRRAGWQPIRCALHADKTASASVNFSINRFCCLVGCTEMRGEDSVGLIQLVEGCDFLTAVAEAERITGQSSGEVRSERQSRRDLFGGSWNHG